MSTTPAKGTKEVITKKNFKKVTQSFEDSILRCWRTSRYIVPKMLLTFKVHFQEIYASTPGVIYAFTPFWRGDTFSDSIMMHEFLHWAIYPVDLFRSIGDIFSARRLLAEELKYTPKLKEADLYGETQDWSDFGYDIKEFAHCANILSDYFINIHIHDYFPPMWSELWTFLYHDGTFYEEQKQLQRDTTFILYLSVYPEVLPELQPIALTDKKTEEDRDKILKIYNEVKAGRMSWPFGIKEIVKIFHDYIQKDKQDGKGKGKGQQGEPKCPSCGHDEFEIVEYQDPKTGKWVKA